MKCSVIRKRCPSMIYESEEALEKAKYSKSNYITHLNPTLSLLLIMNDYLVLTMKDIAKALGISVATVSRALNDSPSISHERREMIQKYAREHNFTPNILAKDLRNTKIMPQKIIGMILPEVIHYYFASVLAGVEEEARKRGYRVLIGQSHESYEREVELCQSFLKSRVCGIIVSLAKDTKNYDHFQELQRQGLPLVFYDRICHGINASRVVVDDYHGVHNAVSHLIKTGCRRIAFYGSPMHLEIAKNRHNGYKDALLQHGIPYDETLTKICDNRDDAETITPELLDSENRPDAFFAINDDTAIGILRAVKKKGFKVPEDISIFGFSDGFRSRASDPQLTSVNQRGETVGREAVDILIKEVEGILPADKVNKRVIRTELVLRETTREIATSEQTDLPDSDTLKEQKGNTLQNDNQ